MAPETEPNPTPRTIVRLEIDSYKRLRAAAFDPSPTGMIPVRGRNAQGKSSLLDALAEVLGASRSSVPITEGAHGGSVLVELAGDDPSDRLVVRERLSRDSGGKAKRALTIEAADGSKVKGPSGVLKALRGRFADPVAFLDMDAADQVKTVLGVLGLDNELQRLEEVAGGHYDRRRDLGRDADRLQKALGELTAEVGALPDPPSEGSVQELTQQLTLAKDHNAALDAWAAKRSEAERRGKALAARIQELEAELEQAKRAKAEALAEWRQANEIREGSHHQDTAPIEEALARHEEAAKAAGRRELLEKTRTETETAVAEHKRAEMELGAARQAIAELLGSVDFPLDGMAYDHEAKLITIGGIPFGQASQGERLKAAAAVAMAGDPPIRVLFAKEGSLLDDESRALLSALADARGFQLWLEVVDSNPDGAGVWIEDGEIR